ncbi:MAG TPA: hypothetical protein VIK86_01220 [Candidatus Paceibacterota bacterium]
MPTNITTDDLVEIKDLGYLAASNLQKISIQITAGVFNYTLVEDIKNLTLISAYAYSDSLIGNSLKPKGNLSGIFSSITLNPDDYDSYYITTNASYDSDLDETFSRGIIYWLSGNWVVHYSEAFLQAQIDVLITGAVFYAGEISADFDVTVLSPSSGFIYKVTKTVLESENGVYYKKGLIKFEDTTLSSIAVQLTEECRMQKFTVGSTQTDFVITDFTLGEYEVLDAGNFRGDNCSVVDQTITYGDATPGTIIKILNLS